MVETQTIAQWLVVSQGDQDVGTNGAAFNTNSAHPFENPTPFSNLLEMFAISQYPPG